MHLFCSGCCTLIENGHENNVPYRKTGKRHGVIKLFGLHAYCKK